MKIKNLKSIALVLLCTMLNINYAWGADPITKEWDLTSTSADFTSSNCETYFLQPYGMKQANAYIQAQNLKNFKDYASLATQIDISVKCLQNGGSTSRLTIYLIDKDGTTLGSSVVTPDNYNNASSTTYKTVSFTSSLTNATGFKVQCTTFGKNILINGAKYSITYTAGPSYTITATRNNDSYGTVSVTGSTITATPATGYVVTAGSGGYTVTSGTATVTNNGDNTFSVSASSDCTIQINFEPKGCTDHYGNDVETATETSGQFGPIYPYYKFSTRQILYTKADLGLAAGKKGIIKSIYFKYGYTSAMTSKTNVDIYMVNSDITELSTSAGHYVTVTLPDRVYSGALNGSGEDVWNEIVLTTPFNYDGAGNLIVVIDDNTGACEASGSFVFNAHTTSTDYSQLSTYSDTNNADPSASATWTGASTSNIRPSTMFCIQEQDMVKYTVTFNPGSGSCGTTELEEATAGAGVTLPTPTHSCPNWTFAGWAESNVSSETSVKPTLYAAGSNYKPASNTTLYAVYKETRGGSSKDYTLTIGYSDFSNSYSTSIGNKNASALDASTFEVKMTSDGIMNQSSAIQFRKSSKGAGVLYNTNDLGNITDITLSGTDAGDITTYINSSADPDSDAGSGGYFKIINTNNNAKTISSITISFTAGTGTTYYHTSPSCTDPALTVSTTAVNFGTKNLNTSTNETITVLGVNLTENASLALSGTDAGMFAVSPASLTQTAGSISGSDNVTITYHPTAEGTHSATLTISSDGATSKIVTLSGTCTLVCSTPTLDFDGTSVEKILGSGKFTKIATATGNTLGATITYSSNKTDKAEVDPATGEVTLKEATGNGSPVTITATLASKSTGVACQNEVTATYTLTIYNKVTWLVNGSEYHGGSPTEQTTQGGQIETFPSNPSGDTYCGGNAFVGWTTEAYKDWDNSSAPPVLYKSLSDMSSVYITANTTFYAVFVSVTSGKYNKYKKGTSSDLTDGQKVIILNTANDLAMKANNSFRNTIAVTPVNDSIATSDKDVVWEVEPHSGGYYFKYNGNYLNCITSSPYLALNGTKDAWTLSGSGPYVIVSGNYTSRALEYYNSNFTSFATGSGNAFNMDFYVQAWAGENYATACGPTIRANDVERLTSTKDQTVKSQSITVRGSNLEGSTLSADITGTDASYFSCNLATSTITAKGITTTYVISYTPTVFGDVQHTATLTFTDGDVTSDPITLHGRSLPEHFAIVGYDGANYYALDGSMSGTAHTVKPLPVTVTDGAVDLCPTQAVYYLTDLDTPDQNVYLVGPAGRLYGEGSGTGLNTKSLSSTSGTNWLLSTNDFNTYHVVNATHTDRGVMYNGANTVFGHYSTSRYGYANYYGDLRLLPITEECTCLPVPDVTRVARSTMVTITWDAIPGAASYVVTCSGGSAPVYDGCKATISGLTKNTDYTFTVKAVAAGTDCSLTYNGSFKTTECDDVPYDISIIPGVKTATIRWKADESSTATIRFYSDEECETELTAKAIVGATSPCDVTGLEENTQYYVKIFAGGTCASSAVSLLTQTTAVEIAEWFPDSIRIALNADEAEASVLIEDKHEHGSGTSNVATDIFFSKYFEASGFTKLVGLYNGTDHDVDISDLIVKAGTASWAAGKGSNNYVQLSAVSKLVDDYGDGGGHIMLPKSTEIILYTIQHQNKADFTGEGCIDDYYNWDDLENNTVANWYRIGTVNSSTPLVDGDGHNQLNFSGPYSVGLFRGSTLIDIIGAGNSTAPDNTKTKLATVKNAPDGWELGNGRVIHAPNDKEGFFEEDGWSPIPQEGDADYASHPEGYSTYLSTNRCLLIRRNHVLSGDSAVLNNGSDFKTLGQYEGVDGKSHKGEWVGVPISNDGTAEERSCLSGAQFGYVGQYNYSDYYASYDSISALDELTGKRNDDGTYTIRIDDLDTLSCTMMKVKVYEGGVEKASREYKVPIMVEGNKTTTDTIFVCDYPTQKRTVQTCKECDVVILKGGKLTKASHVAGDADTVRNVTIYPGGVLDVPEGESYKFAVNSLQFRVQGEETPTAKLKGKLTTADGQVIVSRRTNNDRYVFFSLPYDCNVSDIRWSNGETPVRGTDYEILEYDAERRAAEGSTKGAPGHWKPAGSVLKAGVGYNVATNSKFLKELIFPMTIGGANANLTEIENTKTSNTVTIAQNSGSSSINNHNWNLIAHPYVSPFNAYSDGKITAGWLHCVSPKTQYAEAVWEYVDETNVYLTMPSFSADKITYEQTLSATVGTLDPFLAVFVQGAGEGTLTFAQSNRVLSAPARHLAAKAENEDESIFVGVNLSGNGQKDQTSVRIRPDFTDDYQLGYDLQKFTTYYTTKPQIYMKPADLQLAFQAVSDSVAKNTWMPMGVYCYNAGTYTFSLGENYPIDEVEAVYLYDKTTGITTNLLYDSYVITTTKQLYTNTRFSLNVILNRKVKEVTTDISNIFTDDSEGVVRKILINGHVYIQRGAELYDVTGKQLR